MAGRPGRFDMGCVEYVTVVYPMRVSFPKEMVVCDICPFCHTENSGTRFRCVESGEILPYHNKGTGMRCPLNLTALNQNEEEDEP